MFVEKVISYSTEVLVMVSFERSLLEGSAFGKGYLVYLVFRLSALACAKGIVEVHIPLVELSYICLWWIVSRKVGYGLSRSLSVFLIFILETLDVCL